MEKEKAIEKHLDNLGNPYKMEKELINEKIKGIVLSNAGELEEFKSLSEKIYEVDPHQMAYLEEDVKKAVKLLKEEYNNFINRITKAIPKEDNHNFNRNSILGHLIDEFNIFTKKRDKIFGDKLI